MKKYLLFLAVPLLLTSCFGVKHRIARHLTVESNAIPPDIAKDSTYIVCILTGRNSRDKYLKKGFEKNYHGKYVFLDETRLDKDGYEDVDKYRYVFNYHHYTSTATYPNTNYTNNANNPYNSQYNRNTTVTSGLSGYYIYDRKLNKEYYSKYTSTFFGKYIKAYTEQLEKQRIANGG